MATLSVQEAMGFKIDREAVATLVLPQLWSMSMGPCELSEDIEVLADAHAHSVLNVQQFQRFMAVIDKLGDRVEKEHNQFLRDSQRIEDRSTPANGVASPGFGSGVTFETLVGRSNSNMKPDAVIDGSKSWDDDVWGSIFNNSPEVSRTL